jgi:hypothetical protein
MNLMMEQGDWVKISQVDFGSGAIGLNARIASGSDSGLEVILDGINNNPLVRMQVSNTGGWQNWQTQSVTFSRVTGVHDVYLRSTGQHNLNWYQFSASGDTIMNDGDTSDSVVDYSNSQVLEVELESLADQSNFSPFSVMQDSSASSGQYIEWSNNGNNQILSSPSDDERGQIEIPFVLSETADVEFRIQVSMANANDDSFYYKLDTDSWNTQNNTTTNGWDTLTPMVFSNLSEGHHALKILHREDGAKLDTVTLTTSVGSITVQ